MSKFCLTEPSGAGEELSCGFAEKLSALSYDGAGSGSGAGAGAGGSGKGSNAGAGAGAGFVKATAGFISSGASGAERISSGLMIWRGGSGFFSGAGGS